MLTTQHNRAEQNSRKYFTYEHEPITNNFIHRSFDTSPSGSLPFKPQIDHLLIGGNFLDNATMRRAISTKQTVQVVRWIQLIG